jgi:hypothetical protein
MLVMSEECFASEFGYWGGLEGIALENFVARILF